MIQVTLYKYEKDGNSLSKTITKNDNYSQGTSITPNSPTEWVPLEEQELRVVSICLWIRRRIALITKPVGSIPSINPILLY